MFSSLPLIEPRETHTLWHSPTNPSSTQVERPPSSHHQQHSRNRSHVTSRPSVLHQLELEEQQLMQRKLNIRRFGSTWLRPPGVSKTLQAMVDEAAERAEQEALARREAALAEQHAAAEAAAEEEERRRRGAAPFGTDGDTTGNPWEETAEERDLDDEVPEAEDNSFDDDEEEENDDGDDEDLSDNGDHDAMQGHEERERDLDDEIPDAGSYQHTDTDVEDESSADESSPIVHGPTVIQDFRQPPNFRVDSLPSSPQAESSMLVSSPSAPRAAGSRPVGNQAASSRSTQRPPRWNLGQPDFSRQ